MPTWPATIRFTRSGTWQEPARSADQAGGQEPRVLAQEWIPLNRAALCLDCEGFFPLAAGCCPRCGSRAWTPLEKFLMERACPPLPSGRQAAT